MARVGILGGTFNPPHLAHLLCGQEAHAQLGLDRVLLIPVAAPPHKEFADDPGPEHRLALCRAAVASDERFAVSTIELDRGGPSYTVDTLRVLHDEHPEDDLTFIAGGDMARSLPTWKEPESLLGLAAFAVAERESVRRGDISESLRGLRGAERLTFFSMPRMDISSSAIRRRVKEGKPIRYLVPDAVDSYVREHGLYRSRVNA